MKKSAAFLSNFKCHRTVAPLYKRLSSVTLHLSHPYQTKELVRGQERSSRAKMHFSNQQRLMLPFLEAVPSQLHPSQSPLFLQSLVQLSQSQHEAQLSVRKAAIISQKIRFSE